jgi:uncharacterized protein YndB with AHSA1/START domain
MGRIDTASRIVAASPETLYRAHLDPDSIAAWRPPLGMRARIFAFDPREGGTYRMAFEYETTGHDVRGKTSEHVDVFEGCFVELVPNQRIVEEVTFESADPAFAGTMRIVTTFTPIGGSTEVAIRAENVPAGIRPEDHRKGMESTLANLAKFAEQPV